MFIFQINEARLDGDTGAGGPNRGATPKNAIKRWRDERGRPTIVRDWHPLPVTLKCGGYGHIHQLGLEPSLQFSLMPLASGFLCRAKRQLYQRHGVKRTWACLPPLDALKRNNSSSRTELLRDEVRVKNKRKRLKKKRGGGGKKQRWEKGDGMKTKPNKHGSHTKNNTKQ